MDVAVAAINYFEEARELFQTKYVVQDIGSFISRKLLSDSHALMGIVETNLKILSLILESKIFKKSSDAKEAFLKMIRNGSTSFYELEKYFLGYEEEMNEWDTVIKIILNEYKTLFSNVYGKVKKCLADGVRRLTQSMELVRLMNTKCHEFERWFKVDVVKDSWKGIVNSGGIDNNLKLMLLQPYKDILVIHNFKQTLDLVSSSRLVIIRNLQDIMMEVLKISSTIQHSLSEHDKICYVTLYFVLQIKAPYQLKLRKSKAIDLCLDLVSVRSVSENELCLHPEWCLMFIALHWSKQGSSTVFSEDIEAKFRTCLKVGFLSYVIINSHKQLIVHNNFQWLREYCKTMKNEQPYTYFRLDWNEDGAIYFINPKEAKDSKGELFKGHKNLNGEVTMTLPGIKGPIAISCDKTYRKINGDVTFNINFTQFGPIAFGVSIDQDYLTSGEQQDSAVASSLETTDEEET